jgi:phosphohistidine phosphatase SixA
VVRVRGVWLLLAVMTLGGWACAPAQDETPAPASEAEPAAPVRIVLVRHAENTGDALTEAGWRRAENLAAMFEHSGVTHLYASDRMRSQETLQPLAERTGLAVDVLPAADHAGWITALEGLPAGALAVVAGHSNTVPAMVRDLGGSVDRLDETGNLPHHTYDRIFLVVRGGEGPAACLDWHMLED